MHNTTSEQFLVPTKRNSGSISPVRSSAFFPGFHVQKDFASWDPFRLQSQASSIPESDAKECTTNCAEEPDGEECQPQKLEFSESSTYLSTEHDHYEESRGSFFLLKNLISIPILNDAKQINTKYLTNFVELLLIFFRRAFSHPCI